MTDTNKIRVMDLTNLEVFAGVFETEKSVEEYVRIVDGKPKRLMDDLYLQGEFIGHVEYRFFSEKTNSAESALKGFPYGDKIIEVLKSKFANKFKKKVNTVIILYDFHLGSHFSNHNLRQMKECKKENYHIFSVENVFNYKNDHQES